MMNCGSGGNALGSMEQANDQTWESLLALPDLDEGSAKVVDTAHRGSQYLESPHEWCAMRVPCESPLECCFVWLTPGWEILETRPPVALESFPELFTLTVTRRELPPGTPPPHLFDGHRDTVGFSAIPAVPCMFKPNENRIWPWRLFCFVYFICHTHVPFVLFIIIATHAYPSTCRTFFFLPPHSFWVFWVFCRHTAFGCFAATQPGNAWHESNGTTAIDTWNQSCS